MAVDQTLRPAKRVTGRGISGAIDLVPFPVEALAPWQRDMVNAVSSEAQTDPAMAAMFCLGFSSFTVARNVQILGSSGAVDPLALWIVVIAESGEGKGRTFNPLLAPLQEVERVSRGAPAPPANPTPPPEARQGPTHWERIVGPDPFEEAPQREEFAEGAAWATVDLVANELIAEQGVRFPGTLPRFIERSITPEELVQRMARQATGILQASPEGQVLTRVTAGGPQALEALAHYNSMWSGEAIPVGRVGRDAASPQRPVLTLVSSPQPEAFAEIRGGRLGRLVERTGFLMRCLLCRPASNVGQQQPRSRAIPDDVRARYAENLRAMLAVANVDSEVPKTVRPISYVAWDRFFTEVERRRARGGDLHEHAAWATRVRQSTARLAGILHVARWAGTHRERTFDEPLREETMERAITIGRWLLLRGREALDAPTDDRGPNVLGFVRRNLPSREFGARDVYRPLHLTAADVEPELTRLVVEGRLTVREDPRFGSRYRLVTGDA